MPSRTTLTLLHKEGKKRVFLQGTVQQVFKRDNPDDNDNDNDDDNDNGHSNL